MSNRRVLLTGEHNPTQASPPGVTRASAETYHNDVAMDDGGSKFSRIVITDIVYRPKSLLPDEIQPTRFRPCRISTTRYVYLIQT